MNKFFTKIATAIAGFAMVVGVGVGIGLNFNKQAKPLDATAGDVLKTYDTASNTFSTGYARQSGDNFVWWGQKGFYGSNNATNHGNLKPTAADLPVVKAQNPSATTNTTGLYYCYSSEAVSNVDSLSIYFSAKSGSSTVNAYVVSSSTAAASESTTWSKVTLSSSSTSAQGANVASANTYTFKFDATETDAKYYGVVFVTSSYWRATNLQMKLIEGQTSSSTESILVEGAANTVYVGDNDLSLTATPSNFTPVTYTWNSSDPTVATVSGTGTTGTVHAVAKGTTTITASATGTNGVVTSNSYVVTVKHFSISLDKTSVALKPSNSTTVKVTSTDPNGTVVVTATSANENAATTSVSGSTITITTGTIEGISTTITVSAKDNNGGSGFHTAASQIINVTVTGNYSVGNKITSLPASDTKVFLANGAKTSWVGGTGSSLPETANFNEASVFVLSSSGTLKYFDQNTGNVGKYVYCNGNNTTVSLSNDSANWSSGMSNENYPGLLQLSGGRFLMFNSDIVKAYAGTSSNLSNNSSSIVYAYLAIEPSPSITPETGSISIFKGQTETVDVTIAFFNPVPTLECSIQGDEENCISSATVGSINNLNKATVTIVATTTIGEAVVRVRDSSNPTLYYADITVRVKADAKPLVNALTTQTTLAYHYESDGNGGFNYSNISIRFGGLLSKTLWDEIDTNYHDIDGFGVMIVSGVILDQDEYIKDYLNDAKLADAEPAPSIDNADIVDYYMSKAEMATPPESGDNYVWNLFQQVDEADTAKVFVAVAYIKVGGEYAFMNQVRYSVETLAADYIANRGCNAQTAGGSLDYLAA